MDKEILKPKVSDEEVDEYFESSLKHFENEEDEGRSGFKASSQSEQRRVAAQLETLLGENFTGFQKNSELAVRLPEFKEFYLNAVAENPEADPWAVVAAFSDKIEAPFFPRPWMFKRWITLWNVLPDLRARMDRTLRTRQNRGVGHLDVQVNRLGGMLLDDAMEVMAFDEHAGEVLSEKDRVARKMYSLKVFDRVSQRTLKADELRIRARAEDREDTNFLMKLFNKAQSGDLTQEELATLQASVVDVPAKEIT